MAEGGDRQLSSQRVDTRAVKDKQNLDPVPEDQQEEISSPYKRKMKMMGGDMRG